MHKWQYLGLVSVGCLGLSLTACQTRSEGPLTAEETVAESVVCESPWGRDWSTNTGMSNCYQRSGPTTWLV
jgi:hypothetical protein